MVFSLYLCVSFGAFSSAAVVSVCYVVDSKVRLILNRWLWIGFEPVASQLFASSWFSCGGDLLTVSTAGVGLMGFVVVILFFLCVSLLTAVWFVSSPFICSLLA